MLTHFFGQRNPGILR